jgi:hypothetical protein
MPIYHRCCNLLLVCHSLFWSVDSTLKELLAAKDQEIAALKAAGKRRLMRQAQ